MSAHENKLKVYCEEDCGNAPKKELLKELAIAYAKGDIVFCLEWVKDEVEWDIVGKQQIRGMNEYEKALTQRTDGEIHELYIHNIITHGNTASLNGTIVLEDEQKIAFCNVYNFSGFGKKAKIKTITSYVIHL